MLNWSFCVTGGKASVCDGVFKDLAEDRGIEALLPGEAAHPPRQLFDYAIRVPRAFFPVKPYF
jgi:hypothetical protein